MKALLRFCSLLILFGLLTRLAAENFSSHVPAGGFLYLEARDVPGYRQRLAEVPALQKLADLDWKKLTLQLYQIALENEDGLRINGDEPSVDDMRALLTGLETRWQELNKHFNGDIAFSVGNFKDVASIFRFNQRMRETLELAFGDMPNEEDMTPEQQAKLEERLAEEARLDALEGAAILGQFKLWIDVKDGAALETKLLSWSTELLATFNQSADEQGVVVQQPWENLTLYGIAPADQTDIPTLCWAIKDDVWVVTFSMEALKGSLQNLAAPPSDALSVRPAYQEALAFIGPADFMFYGDLTPAHLLLKDVITELPDSDEPGPFGGQLPEKVLNWVALDAFLPYVIGSRLDAEGIRTRGRFGFSRETALSRIMIDPEAGPAHIPAFLHKNFNQFAAFNWHLGEGWNRFEKEVMALSPQAAAGLGLGRMLASGQVGFDLKLQLMDHLNGQIVMVQNIDPTVLEKMMAAAKAEDPAAIMQVQMSHPTGGQNYLLGLGMKNEEIVRDSLNRLMTRFHPQGLPEPVLFENHELFYPVPADLQGGTFQKLISYTFLDGYLLIAVGDDNLLKNAVSASQDPALQLSQAEDFKAIQAKLPQDADTIEYTSAEQQQNAMKLLQSSLSMMQTENPGLEIPDLTVLADLIRQSMAVSVRKGLIYEINGLMQFPAPE